MTAVAVVAAVLAETRDLGVWLGNAIKVIVVVVVGAVFLAAVNDQGRKGR